MKKNNLMKQVIKRMSYIAAAALTLAILPLPSDYYALLRHLITFTCIFFAIKNYQIGKTNYSWLYLIIGLIFNPFIPIYLDKAIWILLDVIFVWVFLYFANTYESKNTTHTMDEVWAILFLYIIVLVSYKDLKDALFDPCQKLLGEAQEQCETNQIHEEYMKSKDVFFP